MHVLSHAKATVVPFAPLLAFEPPRRRDSAQEEPEQARRAAMVVIWVHFRFSGFYVEIGLMMCKGDEEACRSIGFLCVEAEAMIEETNRFGAEGGHGASLRDRGSAVDSLFFDAFGRQHKFCHCLSCGT